MSTAKGYQLDQSPLYKLESKRKLAKLLFWDLSRLQALANRTDNYRSKKTMHANKERSLEVPKPALENVQRRIYQLLDRIEKPDYLHSGRKQRSYITNAQVHAGAVWLIKLDIKKFYAAVSSARVYRFFQDVMRCSPDVASLLAKLCTARGHLAIGSRVSQLLAFFSAKPMFDELHARALHGRGGTRHMLHGADRHGCCPSSGKAPTRSALLTRRWGRATATATVRCAGYVCRDARKDGEAISGKTAALSIRDPLNQQRSGNPRGCQSADHSGRAQRSNQALQAFIGAVLDPRSWARPCMPSAAARRAATGV
eukprot:gene44289-59086_t